MLDDSMNSRSSCLARLIRVASAWKYLRFVTRPIHSVSHGKRRTTITTQVEVCAPWGLSSTPAFTNAGGGWKHLPFASLRVLDAWYDAASKNMRRSRLVQHPVLHSIGKGLLDISAPRMEMTNLGIQEHSNRGCPYNSSLEEISGRENRTGKRKQKGLPRLREDLCDVSLE